MNLRTWLAMLPALAAGGAYAAPSAEDYLIRAKFTEGVLVADHIQIVVGVYYVEHDDVWPTSLEEAIKGDPGDPVPTLPTDIVQTASVGPNGVITILFRADVPGIAGKSFTMSPTPQPDGRIKWKCSAPDVAEAYRAKKCL